MTNEPMKRWRRAARNDPTAHLRRETLANWRAADAACKDNTKAACQYMRDRGAFDAWRGVDVEIIPVVEGLPWNPNAPKRIVAFRVTERVTREPEVYGGRRRRRPYTVTEVRATVQVPHWDYDGADPLLIREPWERSRADLLLDHQARWRESDKRENLRSIEGEAAALEAEAIELDRLLA